VLEVLIGRGVACHRVRPVRLVARLGRRLERLHFTEADSNTGVGPDKGEEDCCAARAAKHDPSCAKRAKRADGLAHAAAAARSNGTGDLDGEDLLQHAGHAVAVEHERVHVSLLSLGLAVLRLVSMRHERRGDDTFGPEIAAASVPLPCGRERIF
jgi:hypothetical protein